MPVHLSVCMSICPFACLKNHMPNITMLAVTLARSSSDGNVICYELPVLWMRSSNGANESEPKGSVMFRPDRPGDGIGGKVAGFFQDVFHVSAVVLHASRIRIDVAMDVAFSLTPSTAIDCRRFQLASPFPPATV